MRTLFARHPALWGALALFGITLPYLMIGVAEDGDAVRFHLDGDAMWHGQMPYRDFYFEYPPASIPLFIIPSMISSAHWVTIYRVENAIGWALVIILVSFLTTKRWPLFALALVPAALGPFTLMRMDAWPTAVTLGALIALVRGRTTLAWALLAVGGVMKTWPLALVPVFFIYRRSRLAVASFVVIVLATLLPFVLWDHQTAVGAYNTFRGQLDRHLQLETIGSSILLVLGLPTRTGFDAGSWNVFGGGSNAVGQLQSALQVILILVVAWLFYRSRRTTQDLLVATLATVAVFAFVGKVLSPQYFLWVAPFAVLFPVLVVPLFAACLLSHEIFPKHYEGLIAMHGGPIAALAVRNAVVLVILVLVLRMAWALRRPRAALT